SNVRVVVVKPSGPHHCSRRSSSENASKTRARGPSISRDTTISRSACDTWSVSGVRTICFLLLKLLHVFVQAVEALGPELFEPDHPLVDRLQPARFEGVHALLPVAPDTDQPHLPQHSEVFGHP